MVPEYDGKPFELQGFIDALTLVKSQMGNHEQMAIVLIKTKLKGNTRNLITNAENTIDLLILKLKSSIKGDSTTTISAKLAAAKQGSKPMPAYAQEINSLTNSLKNAYINDGIPEDVATKYSTDIAKTALVNNLTNPELRIVIRASGFVKNIEDLTEILIANGTMANHDPSVIYYTDWTGHYNPSVMTDARGMNQNRGRGGQFYQNSFQPNFHRGSGFVNNNVSYRGTTTQIGVK